MPKKKPYYPNNLKALSKAPSHYFEQIPYNDFMDWKIAGWEIPASVACMIREECLDTGKIKEYIYQRGSSAENKLRSIMSKGKSIITVCDRDEIHYFYPEEVEDVEDT